MWGLVLSAVTIAASMATESSADNDDKALAKMGTTTLESRFSHRFVSGICTCQLLVVVEIRSLKIMTLSHPLYFHPDAIHNIVIQWNQVSEWVFICCSRHYCSNFVSSNDSAYT